MDEDGLGRTIEQAFAIATATVHDLAELETLLGEMTLWEARWVVRWLAILYKGVTSSVEDRAQVETGEILRSAVAKYHQCPS